MSHDQRTLLDEIRAVGARDPELPCKLGEVRPVLIRTPRSIADELHDLARANDVSLNAIVHHLIELGLKSMGRPTIRDRAPSIAAYLSRTRKMQPATPAVRITPPRPDPGEIAAFKCRSAHNRRR